jgi:hypothetical protein
MLSWQEVDITSLLENSRWIAFSPEQTRRLDLIVKAWLESDPPPAYCVPRFGGREDGYVETLVAGMDEQRLSVVLTSHVSTGDLSPPSPEWRALAAYLEALKSNVRLVPKRLLR